MSAPFCGLSQHRSHRLKASVQLVYWYLKEANVVKVVPIVASCHTGVPADRGLRQYLLYTRLQSATQPCRLGTKLQLYLNSPFGAVCRPVNRRSLPSFMP